MRQWSYLLGGLLIWTADFFGLYIVASLFPGTVLARWLTGLLTLIALGLLAALLRQVMLRLQVPRDDPFSAWLDRLTLLGGVLSAVAILYQSLPALVA